MSVTVVVMTDGRRDCLERSLATVDRLRGPVSVKVIHDDTGDPRHHEWLWQRFTGHGWCIVTTDRRSGFAGAYAHAWQWLTDHDRNDWILSTEDDFTFNRDVDLHAVIDVLTAHPHLAQMALRRQAWNAAERAAGGVIELDPDAYTDRRDADGRQWLEHRRFFTTNPSLYRRTLTARGWPTGAHSEGVFSAELFTDPAAACGYWGARDDPPWVTHIGQHRSGHGY